MAWDAADEYLLAYCAEELDLGGRRILIADDNFGALSCALSNLNVTAIHYSAGAISSAAGNLASNHLEPANTLDWLDIPTGRVFDTVLMRMPKSVDLLKDHCQRLRPHVSNEAILICAVMDKYLSRSMLEVLSSNFGATHTTLGRKKARLAVSRFDPALPAAPLPPSSYSAEPADIRLLNYPGVFSANQLDIGSRFFLQQFAAIPIAQAHRIADLACGNGVLGLAAGKINKSAGITFFDDSSIAIQSARESAQANFQDRSRFVFQHQDGMTGSTPESFDLILCNPPFHSGAQQDTSIARRLFGQARQALRPGGELWVVGNRHLRYDVNLQKQFADATIVAANRKFVVIRCTNKS
jgi:16S rRNA (guanine1207-N2)-methyltransferase